MHAKHARNRRQLALRLAKRRLRRLQRRLRSRPPEGKDLQQLSSHTGAGASTGIVLSRTDQQAETRAERVGL